MRRRAFFVVGTDTDVGKTFISSALLGLARARGLRCIGMKPIAAGCRLDAGSLRSDDALSLMSASATHLDYETINPIAFEPHIAPHIAAAQAGHTLRAADLTAYCRAVVAQEVDFVLIEGAGGWLVPINDTETLADVCVELNAAVLLVVALLTAAAIETAGLDLAGWVANSVTGPMSCLDENVDTLRTRFRAPCLGVVPRLGAAEPSAAHPFLDLAPLLS